MIGMVVEIIQRSEERQARFVAVIAGRDPTAKVVLAARRNRIVERPGIARVAVAIVVAIARLKVLRFAAEKRFTRVATVLAWSDRLRCRLQFVLGQNCRTSQYPNGRCRANRDARRFMI